MWQLLPRQQKAAGGGRRGERGQFNMQDGTRNAAAASLWRAQKIEVEGQIYDKMRDGFVTSTLPGDRRYVNVPRPLSASGYSCRIRPGYYFPFLLLRLFLPVRMDGWADLMMSAGGKRSMAFICHYIWDTEIQRRQEMTVLLNSWLCLVFSSFSFAAKDSKDCWRPSDIRSLLHL